MKRIFIGSSTEGLEVAEFIKQKLSTDYECSIWTDDIFKYNDSSFETLLKEAVIFDYGILVATKDDFTESRDNQFDVPRDNVIFEFGLFLGVMGTQRAFIVQEEGSKLPTDLLGITVPRFKKAVNLDNSQGLRDFIKTVKKSIEESAHLGKLSLLPSTALAIGYFNSFLAPLCEHLFKYQPIEVNGQEYRSFQVNIAIPPNLDGDIEKCGLVYYKNKSLEETFIDTKTRKFPVYVHYDESINYHLVIHDVPRTLDGIDKTIELFLRKGHIGKDSSQILLEERELRNFETTLQHLINNDAFAKELVRIVHI